MMESADYRPLSREQIFREQTRRLKLDAQASMQRIVVAKDEQQHSLQRHMR